MSDLLAFLQQGGYRTEQISARSVEAASWPRSLALDRARMDLVLYLEAWQASHPGTHVHVERV